MPAAQPVDLLIEARWLVPVAPAGAVHAGHAVAIGAGRIVATGPAAELVHRYAPRDHVRRPDHVLLPGLVNAHVRAGSTLLRSLPVRSPLLRWLEDTVRPAERRWLGPEFVRDGVRLACAEMLRAGITTFADAGPFPEETARVAAESRMRAVVGLPVSDEPTPWARDATEHLARGEHLWDEYREDAWVSLCFAPDASAATSDATLGRVRRVADELDARIAASTHRTEAEVRDSLARHGVRPLQRLANLGLLRPGFTALHVNRLEPGDVELAAQAGIAAVACPQSGLRLGSGAAPVRALLGAGVGVGVGSDGAASAGCLDVLAEARLAALLAAQQGGDGPLGAHAAIALATLGGAQALGLAHEIGSLEPGKAADLVCLDLAPLATQPDAAPADALVFAATRQQVSDVWIAGRPMVAGGRVLAFDERELLGLAREWAQRLDTGATP